jgi:hypothetical protein
MQLFKNMKIHFFFPFLRVVVVLLDLDPHFGSRSSNSNNADPCGFGSATLGINILLACTVIRYEFNSLPKYQTCYTAGTVLECS